MSDNVFEEAFGLASTTFIGVIAMKNTKLFLYMNDLGGTSNGFSSTWKHIQMKKCKKLEMWNTSLLDISITGTIGPTFG